MADRIEAARAIDAFLRAIGRDPEEEPDLKGTGERVAAAYLDDLCVGYTQNPAKILAQDAMPGKTEIVVARALPVATTCPHHLMQAWGEATVAFAPKEKIVGIGAIARALDACAHRLVLQERIGEDLVAAIQNALGSQWAACRISLEHGCMVARGERAHHAKVETIAVAGEGDRARIEAILLGA
ncbi:MAG: GTP cyclohydrolase I, partial [Polyangiaceae bacterium]